MSIITPEMYDEFDPQRIVFEPAKHFSGPNGSKFSRIFVKYEYNDGTVDTLVLQTPVLFTWGVSLGKPFNDNDVSAPQLSLVSYNSTTGPTQEEEKYLDVCNKILSAIKTHLKSEAVKEELDKWDMDSDVKAMKMFYVKMERGKPVKGFPPTLYSKLYFQKSKDGEVTITSRISDAKTGDDLPSKPPLGPSTVYTTIVFSNVFIGAKPSLQTRIGEVMVVEKRERKRYLKPMPEDSGRSAEPREPREHERAVTSVPIVKLKTLKKQHN